MNRNKVYLDRLTKLADWLEAGAPHEHVKFNMGMWLELKDSEGRFTLDPKNACGSVCCISGAAVQFFAPKRAKEFVVGSLSMDMVSEGADVLGLDRREALNLFLGGGDGSVVLTKVTPKQAGAVVRHLIGTGKVDWSVAKKVRA